MYIVHCRIVLFTVCRCHAHLRTHVFPHNSQFYTIPQDPTEVIDRHGADALRLYLINSPVVRAETLKFNEEGVKSVIKDVFLPWYNAYRFLGQNVLRLKLVSGVDFVPSAVRMLQNYST